jgi:hypothetical protein
MAAELNPWSCATTTSVSWSAPKEKFAAAKRIAHVRRNFWCHSQASPSRTSSRSDAVEGSRSSWKGVRIATSVPNEKAYEMASTMNGNARPMPKSAPPSGGPARMTVE